MGVVELVGNAIPDVGASASTPPPGVDYSHLADYYINSLAPQQRVNEYLAAAKTNADPNLWSSYLRPNEYQDLQNFLQAHAQNQAGTGPAAAAAPLASAASSQNTGLGAPSPLPSDVVNRLTAQYPGFSGLLQIPDIAVIAEKWLKDPSIPVSQITNDIQNTNWYKTTPDNARNWTVTLATNPAQAHNLLVQTTDSLRQQASQLGLPVDETKLMWLGLDGLQNGWNSDELKQRLSDQLLPTTGDASQLKGGLGAQADTLRSTAQGDYALPISNQALYTWTRGIADGSQTIDGFNNYVKDQAKSLYPGLSEAIDSGITVKTYASPYIQQAAKTLEIPPDSIDLIDPKWNRFLNQVDPKTGARSTMSLSDATTTMMQDPIYGYDTTKGAMTQASNLAEQIGQKFGAV